MKSAGFPVVRDKSNPDASMLDMLKKLARVLSKEPVVPVVDPERVRLEAENTQLKLESRRYGNIINSSLNPIWHRDMDLKIIYCNLAFSEVAEATTESVIALGEMELFKGHRQLAQKALETNQEQTERRHIVVDGVRHLYQIREVPIKGEGVIGYAMILSELEKAREETALHVRALKDLLDSSTSAMAIYGPDMKLKFYNFAFVALWKHDEGWLDSEPTYGEVLEVTREKRKLPEQANFKAFKQNQLKLFTTLIEPQEEFLFLPDGKTLRVIAIPHALGGILFAYEDVTDRLALERSYNTLIAVQRETLDHLHEGIAVFGENGRLHLCNPIFRNLWKIDTEFTSVEPTLRDVLNKCRDYFSTEDWPAFQEKLIAKLQGRQFVTMQLERVDGSVINCSSAPLPDGATLLSFTDITDSTLVERSLRERAEAMEMANRLKTEFLANMSYELRSPLTSISGFAEMLTREYAGALNPSQKDYVEGIYQSSQHLGGLIGDIIDLATIEAGFLKLNVRAFPVQAAVESVLVLLGTRLKLNHMTIDVQVDAAVEQMEADEVRFKQILLNLLSNAVKISKARGKINLRVDMNADLSISLSVQTAGVVLEASRLEQMFQPFLRSGTGPTSDSVLSLGLVKRFTELHGGTVTAVSDAEQGTVIVCHFPPLPAAIASF